MTVAEVENRNVLVMGLGRFGGGIGVTRWLCSRGANVVVTDLAGCTALAESIAQLADCPVTYHLGGHDEGDLDWADLVVVNPAVNRRTSAFFAKVVQRQDSIPWTTEINLFLQLCPGRVVGVTGTAGKSTTCALLYQILRDMMPPGPRAWFGGNVGRSLLGDVQDMQPHDVVVLELSSFQLDAVPRIARSPEIGLITNLWPNHLDWHGDFESYVSAKLHLLRYQQPGDRVVLGDVDAPLKDSVGRITAETGAKLVVVPEPAEAYALRLAGRHNQRNAACAAVVARLLGVGDQVCRARMAEFGGLPHRLEHVGVVEGVVCYNDSKSTTPDGTAAALAALDGPVVVIVGGQDRGDDWGPLVEAVLRGAKAVVCMGECGPRIAAAVESARQGRSAPAIQTAADMPEAVDKARSLARRGDVILLSPGAPSYGEFVNYEHRGRAFIDLVRPAGDRQ